MLWINGIIPRNVLSFMPGLGTSFCFPFVYFSACNVQSTHGCCRHRSTRKIKRGTKPGHASEKTLGHNYGGVTLG